MFVLFINDLPDLVKSTVYLFADDTKIFKIIREDGDEEVLQGDLNILQSWSEKWLLKFHPQKCKFIKFGKGDTTAEYNLGGLVLDRAGEEKNIGVYMDSDLTFEKHINEKVKKANSMCGLIRRIFHYIDEKTFVPLYKSSVRTQFDYASPVWSPYKQKHIDEIEAVQRRATRQLPGLQGLDYTERLRKLKLPTLAYRRLRGDLIEIYKKTSGVYDERVCDFVKMWSQT